MKKPLRYMLPLVLMLALMLSMGTAAFADKTDSGLPVEYVSYGVGLSDAPGVDKHGLGDDDITIDGVSWRTDTTEDALHVHVRRGRLDLFLQRLKKVFKLSGRFCHAFGPCQPWRRQSSERSSTAFGALTVNIISMV